MEDGKSTIEIANIEASNGLINTVDSVLLPPSLVMALANFNVKGVENEGIVSMFLTAITLLDFSWLTAITEGPFTLFVPTNEAFVAAGITDYAIGVTDNYTLLRDLLLYHVIRGSYDIAATVRFTSMVTEIGPSVGVKGLVLVDAEGGEANIIDSDIKAFNGYVHIIDKVLLPAALPPLPRSSGPDGFMLSPGVMMGMLAGVVIVTIFALALLFRMSQTQPEPDHAHTAGLPRPDVVMPQAFHHPTVHVWSPL
ncbi:unnamed protein product [Discosporangium mesarthrocarpum]